MQDNNDEMTWTQAVITVLRWLALVAWCGFILRILYRLLG